MLKFLKKKMTSGLFFFCFILMILEQSLHAACADLELAVQNWLE